MDVGDRTWMTRSRIRGKGCDPGVEAEWRQEGKGHILRGGQGCMGDCYMVWESGYAGY